jgi:hypothetical protein
MTFVARERISAFHPMPRFAAVFLNGAYRQYSGHQADLAGWLKPTLGRLQDLASRCSGQRKASIHSGFSPAHGSTSSSAFASVQIGGIEPLEEPSNSDGRGAS